MRECVRRVYNEKLFQNPCEKEIPVPNATLAAIDKKLDRLEPGSLRHNILAALRQFRASWVELGRLLNDVALGGDFKEWGYDDFEVYCARELGLKRPTVQKLMVSYTYMKKHEPKRLRAFEDADDDALAPAIPDYQTVDLLNRARGAGIDDKRAADFHARAFAGEATDETETILRKELRESLRPARSEAEMQDRSAARKQELARIQRLGRELRVLLAHTRTVPDGVKGRIDTALMELEALD